MTQSPNEVVARFAQQLTGLSWVRALHVGGSLATGDYRDGVSDLDLVAVTADRLSREQRAAVTSIHQAVEPASKLGCTYVPVDLVDLSGQEHDTWTHGQLIRRPLSGIARAELAKHGYAVFGVQPADVWPSMSADDIARAAGEELTGYWSWAVRRPWLWLGADHLDLAVTTMLRAHRALTTGELITKSSALEDASSLDVPTGLVAAVRGRRNGQSSQSFARRPLDALASWRLTLDMVRMARSDPRLTSHS